MAPTSQRGLQVWFRDEIHSALAAVDIAHLELLSAIDSPNVQMYRKGYAAALRAVAAAFGLSYSPKSDPGAAQVIESPAWTLVDP